MRRIAALFIIAALIGACGPKRVRVGDAVNRGNYAYARLNDGAFAVAAVDGLALTFALAEIGCSKQFICKIQPIGTLYIIEQTKKEK